MQSSPALKEAVEHFYQALISGDASRCEALLSRRDDLLMIGTAPEEWWADHATVMRELRAQAEAFGTDVQIVGSAPQAFEEGSVGWVADQCIFRFPDGTDAPVRITAVYHREDGDWKMVQGHTSLGVRNAAAYQPDVAQSS